MKLLWIADRLHLNKYGRLILKDSYCAMPHGPVPSETLDLVQSTQEGFFSVKSFDITADSNFNEKYFSHSDLEIMNLTWDEFGDKDQFLLRDFSHKFPEWKRFEKDLKNNKKPNSYPILMDDFFLKPSEDLENFNYHNNEESVLSKLRYQEYNSIQAKLL
ncbi:MAG TPA: Panacea domain-containing protein [Vicingaceae bacterium]